MNSLVKMDIKIESNKHIGGYNPNTIIYNIELINTNEHDNVEDLLIDSLLEKRYNISLKNLKIKKAEEFI